MDEQSHYSENRQHRNFISYISHLRIEKSSLLMISRIKTLSFRKRRIMKITSKIVRKPDKDKQKRWWDMEKFSHTIQILIK